jgi:hypothetical protein
MLAASCLAGVWLGIAVRVAMRFVALESGVSVGFSVGGSLEVVAFGAMIGTPAALLFFVLRPRWPGSSPWAGVLCGLLLLAVLAILPLPAARSALRSTPDTPAATATAFGIAFVAWGLTLDYLARCLRPGGYARASAVGARR